MVDDTEESDGIAKYIHLEGFDRRDIHDQKRLHFPTKCGDVEIILDRSSDGNVLGIEILEDIDD